MNGTAAHVPPEQLVLAQAVAIVRKLVPHLIDQYMTGISRPVGIERIALNPGNRLTVQLTDDQVIDVGEIETLKGDRGPPGIAGMRGPRGQRGARGDGVSRCEIRDGRLIVEFGDGMIQDAGELPVGADGTDGAAGVGIHGFFVLDGDLIVELTNDQRVRVGPLPRGDRGEIGPRGEQGVPGQVGPHGPIGPSGKPGVSGQPGPPGERGPTGHDGSAGEPGAGIARLWTDDRGFSIELTNGQAVCLGQLPRGEPGPIGERGPRGEHGEPGVAGIPGRVGDRGPVGPIGVPGEPGTPGERGPQGKQGIRGEFGPMGLSGPQGDIGEPGPIGERGPRGDFGPMGPQGTAGLDGKPGDVGPAGDRGPRGEMGPIGLQGLPGMDGKPGERGPVGERGPRGEFGPQGVQGKPGEKGDSGESGIGLVGCRVDAGNLWIELSDGRIVNAGPLPHGPKGDAGAMGATGRPGLDGQRGDQGERGLDGAPGPQGVSVEKFLVVGDQLNVSLSDGTAHNAGPIPAGPVGPRGFDGAAVTGITADGGICQITLSNGREFKFPLPAGERGPVGRDGLGVGDAEIEENHLILSMTDGRRIDVGRVVGRDGKTPDLANVKLSDEAKKLIGELVTQQTYELNMSTKAGFNDSGELCLELGGNRFNLGNVHGRDGESVKDARLSASGNLILYLTDRSTGMLRELDLGPVRGQDGANGQNGAKGVRGERGFPGRGVVGARVTDHRLTVELDDGSRLDAGHVTGRSGPGFLWLGKWQDGRTYHGQADNPDGPWADVITYRRRTYVCVTKTGLPPPGNGWEPMFREL